MTNHPPFNLKPIASWQRGLLIAAAVSSTLLIAMGGVLCVTHFIRTCPDWPGCFGRIVPPAQTGPILEYTHRFLAAITGILILSSAITGLLHTPRSRWLVIPPWIAVLLLIEVSYFGARVVLVGLAPGWAAVDVGSALLVVALMVTTAVIASRMYKNPDERIMLSYNHVIGWLAIATTMVVYVLLISGVLVAGNNSITACLGWPVYSKSLLEADLHTALKTARWALSFIGIVLIVALLVQTWRARKARPLAYVIARWVGVLFVLEALLQVFLLVFDLPDTLLIPYTITMAGLWAMLVALLIVIGIEGSSLS